MSELSLLQVTDDSLGPVTLRLEPGLSVLSGPPAPLVRLVEIASGLRKPRRGRVVLRALAGTELRIPERIATLLPDEELLAAVDVEHALAAVLSLRQLALDPRELLRAAGLNELGGRRPSRLDSLERRAVQLALALADKRAEALVLYDPLSVSPLVSRDFVLQNCLRHAREKPVFVVTPYLEDALMLGGNPLTFLRGTVFAGPNRGAPGVSAQVRSRQARRLAGLLASEPGVVGIVFDAERAPFEVSAKSIDPEVLAETIARVASDNDLPITSLVVSHSPLAGVGAAPPPAPPFAAAAWSGTRPGAGG